MQQAITHKGLEIKYNHSLHNTYHLLISFSFFTFSSKNSLHYAAIVAITEFHFTEKRTQSHTKKPLHFLEYTQILHFVMQNWLVLASLHLIPHSLTHCDLSTNPGTLEHRRHNTNTALRPHSPPHSPAHQAPHFFYYFFSRTLSISLSLSLSLTHCPSCSPTPDTDTERHCTKLSRNT